MPPFTSSFVAAGCALWMVACVTVNGPGPDGADGNADLGSGGTTPNTSATTPDAGQKPGPPSGGGGGNGGGGGRADSGVVTCPATVTSTDIVEVLPPRDNTQGSCTDAELARVTGTFAGILAAVS